MKHLLITEEEWHAIENYLEGKLDAQSMDILNQKIAEDDIFAKKVRQVQLYGIGIREAEMEAVLQGFTDKLRPNDRQPLPETGRFIDPPPGTKQRSSVRISFQKLAVAASLMLVIASAVYWAFFTKPDLYKQYYKPDTGLYTYMGASQNFAFDQGMVEYKTGNYNAALENWLSLPDYEASRDTIRYFIGNAYLATGKYQDAERYLMMVSGSQDSALKGKADWYLGLIALKQGDSEKAKSYFKRSDNTLRSGILEKLEN